MSYDLIVFQVSAAPLSKNEFMQWYEKQTEWDESHGYNNPLVTSPELQAWYNDMIQYFPSTADIDPEMDNSKMAEYAIGMHMIYIAFDWTHAEAAYELVRALALKHKVGFFDVSADDGEIMRV